MPGARIPSLLADVGGQVLNQQAPINGQTKSTPRECKTINETPVDALILFPPPALCQSDLYGGLEAAMACWATVAEMIVKHRDPSARFTRPKFADDLPGESLDSKLHYNEVVDNFLRKNDFDQVAGCMTFDWTIGNTASTLSKLGPLLVMGAFGPGEPPLDLGAKMHTICVFGAEGKMVYKRDPGNGDIGVLHIDEFNRRGRWSATLSKRNVWILRGAPRVLPRTLGA